MPEPLAQAAATEAPPAGAEATATAETVAPTTAEPVAPTAAAELHPAEEQEDQIVVDEVSISARARPMRAHDIREALPSLTRCALMAPPRPRSPLPRFPPQC